MKIEVVSKENYSKSQNEGLDQLHAAVYPPEVIASLPGKRYSWASPQLSIFLWDQDELVTRVGLLIREIYHDGIAKSVGGIGGVMTHPARQGLGFASRAMREASKYFNDELHVSFALLFCRPHLIDFYQRLLWKPFKGTVYVEQPNGKIEFSVNGAMVLDVKEQAPLNGELDLNGLPW